MTARSIKHVGIFALAVVAATLAVPRTSRADFNVAAGWDLFVTDPAGTSFPGLGNLMGVPLGTFDFDNTFGRGIGIQPTGNTDTVISRLNAVAVAGAGLTGTTSLLMNALQLETTVPVNFGGNGIDNYFVTLQSARPTGGPASTGSMAITFLTGQSGTFVSSLDVFFDIHKGALNGAIVLSSDLVLTSDVTQWGTIPPPGAVVINGANQFLSGSVGDRSQDFWPNNNLVERHPTGVVHTVHGSGTPEPASIALLSIGAVGLVGYRLRRRRAA